MDERLKEHVHKMDKMRELLHQKFLDNVSADELLILSQEMDEMILEYFRLEKECRKD